MRIFLGSWKFLASGCQNALPAAYIIWTAILPIRYFNAPHPEGFRDHALVREIGVEWGVRPFGLRVEELPTFGKLPPTTSATLPRPRAGDSEALDAFAGGVLYGGNRARSISSGASSSSSGGSSRACARRFF